MIIYILMFIFINNSYATEINPFIKGGIKPTKDNTDNKKLIIKEINIDNFESIDIGHFKIIADDDYVNKVISLSDQLKYPDDSIKVIKNANKNRNKNAVVRQKPINNVHFYCLESVITTYNPNDWFVVLNKKMYDNEKQNQSEEFFKIIEIGEKYSVINFFSPEQRDIDRVKENKANNLKYSDNISVSDDSAYISVKMFVGQTYDSKKQRIYDGFIR